MAVPVNIFNASPQSLTVMVNQGSQFSVPGTGPAQNWAPQAQASGPARHTATVIRRQTSSAPAQPISSNAL
jgi:hypothetical protein